MVIPIVSDITVYRMHIKDCIDRGGNSYSHAFIGRYAVSRKLAEVLEKEFGFICSGRKKLLPKAFFSKYVLVAVEPDPCPNASWVEHVTSDYWYTCRERNVPFVHDPQ